MPKNSAFLVGERVQVLLHSRTWGYKDTGGGWTSDWMDGTIVKINPVNAIVRTDEYYYDYIHSVPPSRVRKGGGIQNPILIP